MIKTVWDGVLSGYELGRKVESGDEIVVVYRCNWHRAHPDRNRQ